MDQSPTRLPVTIEASINLHVALSSSPAELDHRDGFAHGFVFVPRQDGCLYRDQQRSPRGRCRFRDGVTHPTRRSNHKDGSFATNELGVRAGVEWLLGTREAGWSLSGRLGLVLFRPTAGGLDRETEAVYGVGRSEMNLRVTKRVFAGKNPPGELGTRLTLERRFGRRGVLNPYSLLLDTFLSLPAARDWGPFVRAYWGGDYYNVRFDTRVLVPGLGLMWEG